MKCQKNIIDALEKLQNHLKKINEKEMHLQYATN